MKLDKMLIVDLEATCWDAKNPQPANEKSEIIEIGVCLFDTKTLQISDKKSYLISPKFSQVSLFCEELTSISQQLLDDEGIPFVEATIKLMEDFGSKYIAWASWGDYDRSKTVENCHLYNTEYPFSKTHINLKPMFSLMTGMVRQKGLQKALDYYGLTFEGSHHRGVDDAYNTAKVFGLMLKEARKP